MFAFFAMVLYYNAKINAVTQKILINTLFEHLFKLDFPVEEFENNRKSRKNGKINFVNIILWLLKVCGISSQHDGAIIFKIGLLTITLYICETLGKQEHIYTG